MNKSNWPPSDKQAFRKTRAYLSDDAWISNPTWQVLDILELFELKFHALRRMNRHNLSCLLEELDTLKPQIPNAVSEVTRLRYVAELSRLTERPASHVSAVVS